MTDKELANKIRAAVSALNSAIMEASKHNLQCKIHRIDASTFENGETEIINVEVCKRL